MGVMALSAETDCAPSIAMTPHSINNAEIPLVNKAFRFISSPVMYAIMGG